MIDCEFHRRGMCRLGRYGGRPSPGVCGVCQRSGRDRIEGAGDRLRLALHPVHAAGLVPACGGCAKRQRRLNRAMPSHRR